MDPTRMGFGTALAESGDDPSASSASAPTFPTPSASPDSSRSDPERKPPLVLRGNRRAEQDAGRRRPGQGRQDPRCSAPTACLPPAAPGPDPDDDLLRQPQREDRRRARRRLGRPGRRDPSGARGPLPDLRPAEHARRGAVRRASRPRRRPSAVLFDVQGPKYIRYAREATPIVTTADTPFVSGRPTSSGSAASSRTSSTPSRQARVRLRRENERPHDHRLRPDGARGDARGLHPEGGVRHRDAASSTCTRSSRSTQAHHPAAAETGIIVTAEEHQIGGMSTWSPRSSRARSCTASRSSA